jgi:hypothetical protein
MAVEAGGSVEDVRRSHPVVRQGSGGGRVLSERSGAAVKEAGKEEPARYSLMRRMLFAGVAA